MSVKLIPGKVILPKNDPQVEALVGELSAVIRKHFEGHVCAKSPCGFCKVTAAGLSLTVQNTAASSGPVEAFAA